VKRIFRVPVITGGIVMLACLTSLTFTTSSRVQAQGTVCYYQDGGYYQPYGQGYHMGYGQGSYGGYSRAYYGGYGQGYYGGYGQGYYGGYGQNYAPFVRGHSSMFPSQSGMCGNATYGYLFPGSVSSADGGSRFYRPAYGRVYGPHGAYWLY
jgi:hypothetical protein